MIKEAILKLVNGEDLTFEMAEKAMDEIMSGETSDILNSSFLTGLQAKGATIEEITACAKGMRKHAERFLNDQDALEIVGTGGDKSNSFNISTISSLIAASGGVPVAKHGNRAATSKCGAADVLEALGVEIRIAPERSAELLKKINICFMFAQKYHASMRFVAPARKELPMPTVFNILGPLTNPAGANMQLMGVYSEDLVEPLAHVLKNLGVKNGMVVYGRDGLDEISASSATSVCEFNEDGQFLTYEIEPENFGLERCSKEDLEGGTPEENAAIALDILNGAPGPKRTAILMNAGAALHIAKGITFEEGIEEAKNLIDSGAAKAKLDEFILYSNKND